MKLYKCENESKYGDVFLWSTGNMNELWKPARRYNIKVVLASQNDTVSIWPVFFSCVRQTLTTGGPSCRLWYHCWQRNTHLETTKVWWGLTAHWIRHRETGCSQDHMDQGGLSGCQDTDMRSHKASGRHALPVPCHGCQQGGQQSASGVWGRDCSQETCRWEGRERDEQRKTETQAQFGGGWVGRCVDRLTDTQTCTYTDMHARLHALMDAHTQNAPHKQEMQKSSHTMHYTHTGRWRDRLTDTQMHARTHARMHKHTHTHTHTHTWRKAHTMHQHRHREIIEKGRMCMRVEFDFP